MIDQNQNKNRDSNTNNNIDLNSPHATPEQKVYEFNRLLKDDVILNILVTNVFPASEDRDILRRLYNTFNLDLMLSAVTIDTAYNK